MKVICLPSKWQNYLYRPISIERLQAVLHRMTVIDSSPTEHGIALRIRYIPTPERPDDPDFPSREKIVIISGMGESIAAEIADVENDRLPGHPVEEYKAIE